MKVASRLAVGLHFEMWAGCPGGDHFCCFRNILGRAEEEQRQVRYETVLRCGRGRRTEASITACTYGKQHLHWEGTFASRVRLGPNQYELANRVLEVFYLRR